MKNRKRSFGVITLIALIAAVLSALLSCADKTEEKALDSVESIYARIEEAAGDISRLESVDEQTLASVLGVDTNRIKAYRLGVAADSSLADEIGVFELSDTGYAEELVHLLRSRLSRAARIAKEYSPTQYELILKAEVVSKGNFVFYTVCRDTESVTAAVKKAIGD